MKIVPRRNIIIGGTKCPSADIQTTIIMDNTPLSAEVNDLTCFLPFNAKFLKHFNWTVVSAVSSTLNILCGEKLYVS